MSKIRFLFFMNMNTRSVRWANRDGSYHTRCLQAVRASRMVGCRRDGCAESIDRRRRGIRRGGAIADKLGEMNGGKPFRCVRDVRGVTRRATPSTRDANARVDASSCTPHPMRVATGIARHDRGRGRDARRARPTRESNETFSPPSDRVRARRVPSLRASLRASTAPPVASRRAGGRAPVCFFASPPAKIFVHPDASDAIDGASRGLPRWMCPRVARGSRTQGFAVRPRDRVDDKHPASIGDAVSRA